MKEALENEVIAQALEIIDRHLGILHQRELVSTAEVSNLLLDMRSVLVTAEFTELDLDQLESPAPARN